MDEVYRHINALSKVIYDRWGNNVSFDFASFATDNNEMPFRITWTLADHTRIGTLNSGERFVPIYQFECVRYLESEMSNLYQFLTDMDAFISLLGQQQFKIVSIGAIDTGTPNRVAIIVSAYR